jgi:hypothetical protein
LVRTEETQLYISPGCYFGNPTGMPFDLSVSQDLGDTGDQLLEFSFEFRDGSAAQGKQMTWTLHGHGRDELFYTADGGDAFDDVIEEPRGGMHELDGDGSSGGPQDCGKVTVVNNDKIINEHASIGTYVPGTVIDFWAATLYGNKGAPDEYRNDLLDVNLQTPRASLRHVVQFTAEVTGVVANKAGNGVEGATVS